MIVIQHPTQVPDVETVKLAEKQLVGFFTNKLGHEKLGSQGDWLVINDLDREEIAFISLRFGICDDGDLSKCRKSAPRLEEFESVAMTWFATADWPADYPFRMDVATLIQVAPGKGVIRWVKDALND